VAGEQATYKVLAASAATNTVGTRIWGGGQAPEDSALPYITLQVVGDADRQPAINGATGLVAKRIQLNCVSTTYSQVVSLADATRIALHAYSGTGGSETVRGIFMENELDVTVPHTEGGDKYVYIKVQDFVVWVDEATS